MEYGQHNQDKAAWQWKCIYAKWYTNQETQQRLSADDSTKFQENFTMLSIAGQYIVRMDLNTIDIETISKGLDETKAEG